MIVTPIDLFRTALHLREDGEVHAEQILFDPERDGWQLCVQLSSALSSDLPSTILLRQMAPLR